MNYLVWTLVIGRCPMGIVPVEVFSALASDNTGGEAY